MCVGGRSWKGGRTQGISTEDVGNSHRKEKEASGVLTETIPSEEPGGEQVRNDYRIVGKWRSWVYANYRILVYVRVIRMGAARVVSEMTVLTRHSPVVHHDDVVEEP